MLKAIDPGKRRLGWATWADGDKKPKSGFFDLRAKTEGESYSETRKIMLGFIKRGDDIVMEMPMLPRGVSIASRLALFGIRAIVMQVAFDVGAKVEEVGISQWRSWCLGVTMPPKSIVKKEARRRWLKERAKQEVEARGWGKITDDEAEAMLMLCWLRAQRDYNYAFKTRPRLLPPSMNVKTISP